MKNQRGVAISGLLLWGFVIVFVALLGMKVVPEYMDYFQILKSVKSISKDSSGQTVADIRNAYAFLCSTTSVC